MAEVGSKVEPTKHPTIPARMIPDGLNIRLGIYVIRERKLFRGGQPQVVTE